MRYSCEGVEDLHYCADKDCVGCNFNDLVIVGENTRKLSSESGEDGQVEKTNEKTGKDGLDGQ
jgi:hypothetical protein